MLRALIQRYKSPRLNKDGTVQPAIIFDMVVVDYADIMQPDFRTNDAIENSKNIWLGLRAIAFEENLAMLTATQTNREGNKSVVAKATDVAEDFNKIRTADIVISINTTDEERAAGESRLFFAASRNQESGFTIFIKQNLAMMRFITSIIRVE
jgi:replicative DNA helicase